MIEQYRCLPVALIGFLSLSIVEPASAARPRVKVFESHKELAGGEFLGAQLKDGAVVPGYDLEAIQTALSGPVLAFAVDNDGTVYAATSGPGEVYRFKNGRQPELVCRFESAAVTHVSLHNGSVYALTAPKAQVHRCEKKGTRVLAATGSASIAKGKEQKANPAQSKDLEGIKVALDGRWFNGSLYVVGGGVVGRLLKISQDLKAVSVVAEVEEAMLRTLTVDKKRSTLVVGGGSKGIVYRLIGKRLQAVYDGEGEEVTSLQVDKKGRIFASLTSGSGKLKDRVSSARRPEANEPRPLKERRGRKVTGSSLVRIDADGKVKVLWASSRHGIYAIALLKEELFLGTGPYGRVYGVDPGGRGRPRIIGRAESADEVVALSVFRGRLYFSTAHSAGVFRLGDGKKTGSYRSPIVDAGRRARYGYVASSGGSRLTIRTGHTALPDATWSVDHPVDKDGRHRAPPGRYAQLHSDVSQQSPLQKIRVSYLRDNQAPMIERIDVLAPHWKVVSTPREPNSSRSVTFGENPFEDYRSVRGSVYPKQKDRASGKQSPAAGFRTVYCYASDADKDLLRYRFEISRDGGPFTTLQDWSEAPFVSFDAAALGRGAYTVRAEVDDRMSNGTERSETAILVSRTFRVGQAKPRFIGATSRKKGDGRRVSFRIEADAPLAGVRCVLDGGWIPIDPKDGILDSPTENFDVILPGDGPVICEGIDESINIARIEIH